MSSMSVPRSALFAAIDGHYHLRFHMAEKLAMDIEPIGVWDANEPDYRHDLNNERREWALAHLGDLPAVAAIIRVEFYLLDTPFAKVWRCPYCLSRGQMFHVMDHVEQCDTVVLTELPPEEIM